MNILDFKFNFVQPDLDLFTGQMQKNNVTIEFYVLNVPYNMIRTTVMQDFHSVASFDRIALNLAQGPYLYAKFFINCEAKVGCAAAVSPVSVADRAESDDFNLWPNLIIGVFGRVSYTANFRP